jgi:hypothetical protein
MNKGLEELKNDEELREKYNITDDEIKMLDEALKTNVNGSEPTKEQYKIMLFGFREGMKKQK